LISSADEVARDVREALTRKGKLAQGDHTPRYEFYTTGNDVEEFKGFGTRVLGLELQQVSRVEL